MRRRVRAARGHGGPREWVLTAVLADAARGPGTRRREIESRECDPIYIYIVKMRPFLIDGGLY